MSEEVIFLTSSDEEDIKLPPAKKLKTTLNLTECTLSVVPNKGKTCSEPEISVVLDSDDEGEDESGTKVHCDPRIIVNGNCIKSKDGIDLITLTDDESDENTVKSTNSNIHCGTEGRINNSEIRKNSNETVSLLDSDSEISESSNNDFSEKPNISIMINDSDEELEVDQNKVDIKVLNRENNEGGEDKLKYKEGINAEKIKEDDYNITIQDVNNKTTDYSNQVIENVNDKTTQNVNHTSLEAVNDIIEENGEGDDVFNVNVSKTSAKDEEKPKEEHTPSSTCTAKPTDVKMLFKQFLRLVEDKVIDSSFEEILPKKMPVIHKYYSKCETYVNDKEFYTLLSSSIDEIDASSSSNAANCAVITFYKVCKQLRAHVIQSTIVIEEVDVGKVKTLEKTINLLSRKIKQLEETEVDFDAENNSSFIQLDRYQVRLSKVYKKYCHYIKRNPYLGRAEYDKINFVHSKHNVINQALTKKYKNSVHFPSYYDLRRYIKKVIDQHKLKLCEDEITRETKKCFKSLGTILQKKRRQELYDSHLAFIESTTDPAKNDISLENALKKSQKKGEEKIKEVCQKFVDLAERGEDNVSSEKETSSESDSDENDDENNETKKLKKKEHKEEEEEKQEEEEEIEKRENGEGDEKVEQQEDENEEKESESKPDDNIEYNNIINEDIRLSESADKN